jgi:hypothetical protein
VPVITSGHHVLMSAAPVDGRHALPPDDDGHRSVPSLQNSVRQAFPSFAVRFD